MTREELRERTTVHFVPYASHELYIGGKTPTERGMHDITVELSDWNMPVKRQRKVAAKLTPVVGELFQVPSEETDNINIRFHSYPPSAFAVGENYYQTESRGWQGRPKGFLVDLLKWLLFQ